VSEPAGAAEPVGRVVAPLVSPNEPEAQVVEVAVRPYAKVSRGDPVCVLETSKASVEVECEHDGYTGPVELRVGDRVTAGQVLCEVYASPPERRDPEGEGAGRPAGLRLTRNAERLAREAGLDLSLLPTGRFVTERDVEAAIAASRAPAERAELDEALAAAIGERSLVVFGAGGHAKSLIDLVRSAGELEPLCVVDDDPGAPADVLGVPVVPGGLLARLREHGARHAANAVGAIGRMPARVAVGRRLEEAGFELPPLVDPAAFVAASATLGPGAQVFAAAAVCSAASVGRSAIVNTGAIVSHDCRIGDYAHVAPGAILAGAVEVGSEALVGMGVSVNIGVRVGGGAIVGNGAVVNEDVPDGAIVPAGTVWPR
jgi:sugar O-acyltransferase (sialic acid O-acetyltransferase NeuD family)